MGFILEGDRRHPRQKIKEGPRDSFGKVLYVDYKIDLPDRSENEFSLWVNRYIDSAQVKRPPSLVEKHRQAGRASVDTACNPGEGFTNHQCLCLKPTISKTLPHPRTIVSYQLLMILSLFRCTAFLFSTPFRLCDILPQPLLKARRLEQVKACSPLFPCGP